MRYSDGSTVTPGDLVTLPVPSGTTKGRVAMFGESYAHLDIDADFLEWVMREKALSPSLIVIEWVAENPRGAVAAASRDMRYFSERLRTFQLMPDPVERAMVAFGSWTTFARDDGRRQTFPIVGEDEADPRAGSISYVSPVARALIGKALGDRVVLGDHEIEVLAVE